MSPVSQWITTLLSYLLIANARTSSPNVLLILLDDLGYSDVGYLGGDIPTPNINELATTGIRFNYHYAEMVCSATRSALLTGRYSWQTNLDDVIGLPSAQGTNINFKLISDTLSDNGYDTLFVGKWHIGSSIDKQLPYLRGFKQSIYFTQGMTNYTAHEYCAGWGLAAEDGLASGEVQMPPDSMTIPLLMDEFPLGFCGYDLWYDNHQSFISIDNHQYVEDIFYDGIKVYLDEYVSSGSYSSSSSSSSEDTEPRDPFFIYWAIHTPHTPLTVPPITSNECDYLIGSERQIQCNMIYYVDILIGDIIDDLKHKKLYEDTVVIFISDNGAQPYLGFLGGGAGQPLPFRGAKGNSFEGGIRTPAFINGGYLKNKYKCNYNKLVHISDFYPMIMHLANINDDSITDEIDGINLWPDIERECDLNAYGYNNDDTVSRNEIISYRLSTADDNLFMRAYVRTNEYKLLINPNVYGGNGFVQSALDVFENWINYDAEYSLVPNETYYRLFTDYDKDNDNQDLFYSKCYEDYLNDPHSNSINTEAYMIGDDKIYLYKLNEDNIEACNIASIEADIVDDLINRLLITTNEYSGSGGIHGDKGAYVAMKDTYDCDRETFFFTTWADNPLYQNVNEDWNTILLSLIDKVESCPN